MPANGFSIGKDVAVMVSTPSGQLTLNGITEFTAKPDSVTLSSKGLGGITRFASIENGWSGTFKVDRLDSIVDDYFAALSDAYYNGKNSPPGTIYETITEASGAVTQWRYEGVVLVLEDHGSWGGDKRVEQSIKWMASRRRKVS
jgi:hypothetical protein